MISSKGSTCVRKAQKIIRGFYIDCGYIQSEMYDYK